MEDGLGYGNLPVIFLHEDLVLSVNKNKKSS